MASGLGLPNRLLVELPQRIGDALALAVEHGLVAGPRARAAPRPGAAPLATTHSAAHLSPTAGAHARAPFRRSDGRCRANVGGWLVGQVVGRPGARVVKVWGAALLSVGRSGDRPAGRSEGSVWRGGATGGGGRTGAAAASGSRWAFPGLRGQRNLPGPSKSSRVPPSPPGSSRVLAGPPGPSRVLLGTSRVLPGSSQILGAFGGSTPAHFWGPVGGSPKSGPTPERSSARTP